MTKDEMIRMARLGWQCFECPACGSEGARAFPKPEKQQSCDKQEPVLQDIEQYRMQIAGICTAAIGYWKECDGIHPDYDTLALRDVAKLYAKYDALYKAPQRKWVGLTTDERANILRTYYADMYDAAEVIEELLKEKNT